MSLPWMNVRPLSQDRDTCEKRGPARGRATAGCQGANVSRLLPTYDRGQR